MINSPIPRIGGKRLLRTKICDSFPSGERFNRYIEVFGGGGWVLFSKEKQADLEIYNDADGNLVNLMRCIKYHCSELQREIDGFYNSREIFYDVSQQLNCRGFTDIQRAARYFIKMRLSFGADGRSFGCSKKPLYRSKDYLSVISDRLKNVLIENKDFENLIKVYDRPSSFFYLDPHITQQKNTMILNLRKMIINVLRHSFRKFKENFCFLIMMIHLFESYIKITLLFHFLGTTICLQAVLKNC